MNNFVFYSPTEFVFGKNTEVQVGALARKYGAQKVMIVYGGGSVVRSGLLDRVKQYLQEAGVAYCEMGGVQPNPIDGKVYEGIQLCRREQVDMMLPVGGGSVIDTAKAIAAGGNNISFIKYINNNINPEPNTKQFKIKGIISTFLKFVDNMLFFASLNGNFYQGFKKGNGTISDEIISNGKLKDFENFLKKVGINYNLIEKEVGKEKKIYCKFKSGEVNFFEIASKGTCSLSLFYSWLIRLNEISFVFIDEFDAFYHVDLAKIVVEKLLKLNVQVILTTHDTTIMTNDLLRPDCYFVLSEGKIKSLPDLTEKELRQAHNLEKMYRAGAFNE